MSRDHIGALGGVLAVFCLFFAAIAATSTNAYFSVLEKPFAEALRRGLHDGLYLGAAITVGIVFVAVLFSVLWPAPRKSGGDHA